MSLNQAHKGYEYQDVLTAYFILEDLLHDNKSKFLLDKKVSSKDKFDDLSIENERGTFKKQIKYSLSRQLSERDLKLNSSYGLYIVSLYNSWLTYKNVTEIRICLAWDEPEDKLRQWLIPEKGKSSFNESATQTFKITPAVFKDFCDKEDIIRIKNTELEDFCVKLIIEVDLPKYSGKFSEPGLLEKIILNQLINLGIGEYPNEDLTCESIGDKLVRLVTNSRANGDGLTSNQILNYLQIKRDYGAIEQIFPVDTNFNIKPSIAIKELVMTLLSEQKVILRGEPGSGKSWLVHNIEETLKEHNIKVVRHLCYIDLDDALQRERISLNKFYGNIISEILMAFPGLHAYKEHKYSSTLTELNLLLENIPQKTILIIDGLDHIQRIYDLNSTLLTKAEVSIIEKVKSLQLSNNITCLLVSQPIGELDQFDDFHTENIRPWSNNEILQLIQKYGIKNRTFENGETIIDALKDKSKGNPLYLTYLIKELTVLQSITKKSIEIFPEHSSNLIKYYDYILSQLKIGNNIPYIFSGISFRLTKEELYEILPFLLKQDIGNSLNKLSPVLKVNQSQGGYSIYHESFRRHIINYLKSQNESVAKIVFSPIAQWLKQLGFYQSKKSYKYYLEILFQTDYWQEILKLLDESFLVNSLFYGHSWESLINNYNYFLRAALLKSDYPKLIILNEINRVLSSTIDEYERSFESYFIALGFYFGCEEAVSNLVFEGKATISKLQGLIACYHCDLNQITPPWDLYIDYFKKGESIEINDFKLYIRYLLAQKDTDEIAYITRQLDKNSNNDFNKVFRNELSINPDKIFINELTDKIDGLHKIFKPVYKKSRLGAIDTLIKKVLSFKNVYDNEITVLEDFFYKIDFIISENKLEETNLIINRFKGINWFYNWVIYYIKIKVLANSKKFTFAEVKEAFLYLNYKTNPFEGEPQTSNLHNAYDLIYTSFNEGLSLLKNADEWSPIIEILMKINNTSVGVSGETWGPLSSDKLFKLLDENANKQNVSYIISSLENLLDRWKEYHLHFYITEYYFRLSRLHSLNADKERASYYLKSGIQFLIGYTFRKDVTIEELIDSIASVNQFNNKIGQKYIKEIRSLVKSVDNHTEGKGTKHFLIEWYEKYFEINPKEALIYLRNQLLATKYYWKLESSLINLLKKTSGTINPFVELFLSRTFLIECSESFLDNSLKLIKSVKKQDYLLAKSNFTLLYDKTHIKSDIKYSNQFCQKVNQFAKEFDLDIPELISKEKKEHYYPSIFSQISNKCRNRKEFSEMTISEITEYIKENEILKQELASLFYFIDELLVLDEETKLFIKTLVKTERWFSKKNNPEIEDFFSTANDIVVYYWVCKYVFEYGGDYERFVNIKAFEKALSFNSELAQKFLEELLFEVLSEISYHRTIPANLINTFVRCNLNQDDIISMWQNLYEAISFRLPVKEKFDWDNALENKNNLTSEETVICILFTRFNANTKERHLFTMSGIRYLLFNYPSKMIKPLKWFWQNHKSFLEITQIIVLEIMFEFWKSNKSYIQFFEDELSGVYSTNSFFIDYLILQLFPNINKRSVIINPLNFKIPVSEYIYEAFVNSNIRFEILNNIGFESELKNMLAKYRNSGDDNKELIQELYYNRVDKIWVDNMFVPNFFISGMSKILTQATDILPQNTKLEYHENLKLQVDLLIAQRNSMVLRPDILKPHQCSNDITFKKEPELESNQWVRLGYIEYEKYKKNRFDEEIEKFRSYSGIAFLELNEETIPFSRYRFNPQHLWEPDNCPSGYDEYVCTFFLQMQDTFEQYMILWLNPIIFNGLGLKLGDINYGLKAYNKNNELCLIFNSWNTGYIGDSSLYNDVTNEIPLLQGSELLLRKDYFDIMCDFFEGQPFYYSLSH